MSFSATDQRAGLTLTELERAIALVKEARPGRAFRLKVSLGWRQQVQKIIFTEVEDAAESTEA